MKIPEVIALDLDNTMYAYEPCHSAAMSAISLQVENRLSIPQSKWAPAYEEAKRSVKARLGRVASSHSRLSYFKGMLENLGMQSHVDLALQLEAIYWGEFIRHIKKADDLDSFLEVAREKGIPVVIVTDLTTGIQIKKIYKLGITDMITALVTSEEVGADKPNIGFHEYITNQLRIEGEHWWVVGDDTEKDGGFSTGLPSSDFHHVSASGRSSTNFHNLSKALKKDLI